MPLSSVMGVWKTTGCGFPTDDTDLGKRANGITITPDPIRHLFRVISGPTPSIPVLRFLAPTVLNLQQATNLTSDAVASLVALTQMLLVFEAPAQHLELALTLHVNYQFRQRVYRHLKDVLATACGVLQINDALETLHANMRSLVEYVGAIWELFFYFCFLDAKGDQALVSFAVGDFAQEVGYGDLAEFANALSNTGQFALAAFDLMSQKLHADVLTRMHVNALRCWQSDLQLRRSKFPAEILTISEKADHHLLFWDAYFSNLFCISWRDFSEAFEEFYSFGLCPIDVLSEVRKRVDPNREHRVRKCLWTKLFDSDGVPADSGQALMDFFCERVLENVSQTIFRKAALEYDPLARKGRCQEHSDTHPTQSDYSCQQGESDPRANPDLHSQGPAELKEVVEDKDAFRSCADEAESGKNTPIDPRYAVVPGESGPRISWEEYASIASRRPTWFKIPENTDVPVSEVFAKAVSVVNSALVLTRKIPILRVVGGNLARGMPRIVNREAEAQRTCKCGRNIPAGSWTCSKSSCGEAWPLPCMIIEPFGEKYMGNLKFGRKANRKPLAPDCMMDEPIASRSHFHIVFDQESDNYLLMDAGSKWGTFTKVTQSRPVSCGDWFRIGATELIVRYCGGGCMCRKKHKHCRLSALRVQKELKLTSPLTEDGVYSMFTGMKSNLWPSKAKSAFRASALAEADLCSKSPPFYQDLDSQVKSSEGSKSSLSGTNRTICVPVPPLEVEFISGPRTGENVIITDRRCVIGRSEACAIQVANSNGVANNISREHLSFELVGGRWHISDAGSTNGTWKRLSCVLEPSGLVPLQPGLVFTAGLHEFRVEHALAESWWLESVIVRVIDTILRKSRSNNLVRAGSSK